MEPLLQVLVTELERQRAVPRQVAKHLGGTYGIGRDEIGAFLVKQLPALEDYEIDLVLSPLFTPTLRDQAVFADLLGLESVSARQWPELIQQLVARPTRARLVTEDGQTHCVPLREVTIARFVERLRLDATIPEPLFRLLVNLPPASDRPVLKAVARRAIWENEPRRQILIRYLTAASGGETYRLEDAVHLLRLAETYEPADVGELLARLPHWAEALRQEIQTATNPKPFFNERVQEMHGGGRDHRRTDNAAIAGKERELASLERLKQALQG
jgi:hypothetical protein